MRYDVGPSTRLIGLFVVLALAVVGCQPAGPKGEPAAPAGTTDAADDQAALDKAHEQPGPQLPAPTEDSPVQLATAESRIPSPDEVAAEPGELTTGEPAKLASGEPALEPPRMLPEAAAPLPLDDVAAADLTMPSVQLTDHHAALCVVGVGDKFPELTLPDVEGSQHELGQLLGEKLSLVVFYAAQEPTSVEELNDLARYLQPRFGDLGLAIVAINTGDEPQLAAELAPQAAQSFSILTDTDGAAFAQVAKSKLPRTYLLDASGTIVWLDLEYSPTTLRKMVQAIRYSLADR